MFCALLGQVIRYRVYRAIGALVINRIKLGLLHIQYNVTTPIYSILNWATTAYAPTLQQENEAGN